VYQWPDGRRYAGQFTGEMMHGEGTLCWSDDHGVCRYKGSFEHNAFQGQGVLEWSTKAKYIGEFFNGLYHGEGTFEWPDKSHAYRGQWQFGEMSGKGTLTASNGSVYSGEFHAGSMDGRGTMTFITNDQYIGEFKDSMFNGMGAYTWSSGTQLVGVFENNFCNQVGKKTYASGGVYVGELSQDLEHGRGVFIDAKGVRVLGMWEKGRLVEELVEMIVPGAEVDASTEGGGSSSDQRVFVSTRELSGDPLAQTMDDARQEGHGVVLFTNGNKYIGGVCNGQQSGDGAFIYADGACYKGAWEAGALDGAAHLGEAASEEARRLNDANEKNAKAVAELRKKVAGEKKQTPSMPDKP